MVLRVWEKLRILLCKFLVAIPRTGPGPATRVEGVGLARPTRVPALPGVSPERQCDPETQKPTVLPGRGAAVWAACEGPWRGVVTAALTLLEGPQPGGPSLETRVGGLEGAGVGAGARPGPLVRLLLPLCRVQR